MTTAALPRDLHPGAWWLWALGLAAAATRTTNPWLLVLLVLVVSFTVVARRSDAPWALSFKLYLGLGLLIVVVRVVFRVLLGSGYGGTVLVDLPEVPLPDWTSGVTLLGPVTAESVLAGLQDGLRLAAIVICVGAANTLANPRRLLASLPPALYEVGAAVVIALSLFPQLAESVQRVRRARRLRGDPGRGIRALHRVVVPVLEDALDRSVALAASMDARGYGRSGGLGARQRRLTGALLVGGLLGLCVGVYGFLDATAPAALGWPMLLLGLVGCATGFVLAGRRVQRTRYEPARWRWPDLMTAACGLVPAGLVALVASTQPEVVVPAPGVVPTLTLAMLAAVLVAALPAVATPPPVLEGTVTR